MPISAARADQQVERTRRISEALCDVESAVRQETEQALDVLADHGALRIHRSWVASEERALICKAAAKAAVAAIMASDWI